MERFIGRADELRKLNELYETEGFHMAVVYGRRRIGKSTLLTKFIQDKKAVYYVATKVGTQRNVELLTKEVMSVLAPEMMNVSFHELEDLLSFMSTQITDEKIVFVIDEIPYWAERMIACSLFFRNMRTAPGHRKICCLSYAVQH